MRPAHPGLANPGKARHDCPAKWICEQLILNIQPNLWDAAAGKIAQAFHEPVGLNEYHAVVYITM